VDRREKLVLQALKDEDHEALGRIATLPGGFGSEELRRQAWYAGCFEAITLTPGQSC
jgi:hypothetical protein